MRQITWKDLCSFYPQQGPSCYKNKNLARIYEGMEHNFTYLLETGFYLYTIALESCCTFLILNYEILKCLKQSISLSFSSKVCSIDVRYTWIVKNVTVRNKDFQLIGYHRLQMKDWLIYQLSTAECDHWKCSLSTSRIPIHFLHVPIVTNHSSANTLLRSHYTDFDFLFC